MRSVNQRRARKGAIRISGSKSPLPYGRVSDGARPPKVSRTHAGGAPPRDRSVRVADTVPSNEIHFSAVRAGLAKSTTSTAFAADRIAARLVPRANDRRTEGLALIPEKKQESPRSLIVSSNRLVPMQGNHHVCIPG